jgi:predicted small secreted protein
MMKKLMLSLAVASTFLTGCIAVPVSDAGVQISGSARSYPDGGRPYARGRDRDGDGVPNRYDRRPANPYRY